MTNKNELWTINALTDLNHAKLGVEEQSVKIISKIDNIIESAEENNIDAEKIKSIAFEVIDMMQHSDLNRQKIERAMNFIIENNNIKDEELLANDIQHIASSAKHIDADDGDSMSEEDLEKLISDINK